MLGLSDIDSLSKYGNGEENFNFSSENPILENVAVHSNTDFLQLTSIEFLNQSQPIDIKQFASGYVEVVGEVSLGQEEVQETGIKKESLPLPDFQQVWMKNENPYQFTSSNSIEQGDCSEQFPLASGNLHYQHSPPSYPPTFNLNQSLQSRLSPSGQYLPHTFPQNSPQYGKTEVLEESQSPSQLEQLVKREEGSPGYVEGGARTSPDYHQSSPHYLWPDQPQQQHQYGSVPELGPWDSPHQSPGTVTVMVLNEDGTLDNRFTLPNDVLSQALLSTSPAPVPGSLISPPLSSPRSPLDLTAVPTSTFSQAAVNNMTQQDMSSKNNMYSFANSNNNAGNLLSSVEPGPGLVGGGASAVSGLKRPLPLTEVLGDYNPQSSHVPQQVIQRAMAEFNAKTSAFNFPAAGFENFQSIYGDQKENLSVSFPGKVEGVGYINSRDGSKVSTKEKSRSSQRSQPYSVNGRKVKSAASKKSIGAIGQTVHGLKENKQVCPLCDFEATTKNPYRHLQDHLARIHFKERLARELPVSKPFNCPISECESRNLSDWQAVMRHYIGNKHGILEKYVREELEDKRV